MGEFHLMHWVVVLGVLAGLSVAWGYPLATLCRRAGMPPAVGWIAGSVGLLVRVGPLCCIWWLALSSHNTPTTP